jgi:hypothetical protein
MKVSREICLAVVMTVLVACSRPGPPVAVHIAASKASAPATPVASKSLASPQTSRVPTDEQIVQEAELCVHFAGELNGDQSDRDKEVTRRLDELQCEQAIGRLRELFARLPRSSPLMDRASKAISDMDGGS